VSFAWDNEKDVGKERHGAHGKRHVTFMYEYTLLYNSYGAFTLDVKLVLNENLGDILGGIQC
jgi:hypothetical protein